MKKLLLLLLVLITYFKCSECITCGVDAKNKEAKLKQDLLCGYDPDTRPTKDLKNATLVKLRMYIKYFEFEDHSGQMTVHSWLSMGWTDEHLKWNPDDYDGISDVTIHSGEIWMPDLTLYNSESTQFAESCSPAHCSIESTGKVRCIPPCSHTGKCKSKYLNWPYDIQNCTLYFGSWMHKGEEVAFKQDETSFESQGLQNNQWKVLSMKAKNHLGNYSCCPNDTYPTVTYNIVIQRHSAADAVFIVGPAMVLVIINLLVLWLDPACMERIVLTVVSLLSHFLFIQELTWIVPKNGDVAPKAIIFLRDSMVISGALLVQTIIMRALIACQTQTPDWIKTTTAKLKGNKIGQFMFTNPYLISTNTTLDNEAGTADDTANLVEGQTAEPTQPSENTSGETIARIWSIAVRLFDTLTFLVLTVCYLVMIFGWLPVSTDSAFDGKVDADIHNDD